MFAKRLKQLRYENKLSQVELAKQLGVNKQNISDWENEKSETSFEMVIEISKLFNVTVGQLLGTEDLN